MREFSAHVSDYALVYHWWSNSPERRVWKHIDVPIILSIATLRAHSPELTVYVVDHSDGTYNWGEFPSRFGFSLVPYQAALEASASKKDIWSLPGGGPFMGRGPLESASDKAEHNLDALDVRRCSRPIDTSEDCIILPERYLISSDCDVFWLKPVLPLVGDAELLNIRESHPGFFYFDKQAAKPKQFLELWQAFVSLATRDFNFRRKLVGQYPYPAVIGAEKPFFYIRDSFADIFKSFIQPLTPANILLPSDHYGYGFQKDFVGSVKAVHVSGRVMGRWKGRFPLFFAEVFEILRNSFSTQELIEIFQMDVFNNSVFKMEDMCEPLGSDFYDQLTERMYAEIRTL